MADTHFVNFHGVVVAGIQTEAGHGRVPGQRDLGRFDQHDADVVDGRRLYGSLGGGHGDVDELPVLGRRQVADTVFGPHVKLVRGDRTQAANRYLGLVEYLLRRRTMVKLKKKKKNRKRSKSSKQTAYRRTVSIRILKRNAHSGRSAFFLRFLIAYCRWLFQSRQRIFTVSAVSNVNVTVCS